MQFDKLLSRYENDGHDQSILTHRNVPSIASYTVGKSKKVREDAARVG